MSGSAQSSIARLDNASGAIPFQCFTFEVRAMVKEAGMVSSVPKGEKRVLRLNPNAHRRWRGLDMQGRVLDVIFHVQAEIKYRAAVYVIGSNLQSLDSDMSDKIRCYA